MSLSHRRNAAFAIALLFAALTACAPTQYRNATHPNYGEAEYKTDLKHCRSQNSKLVTSNGYDVHTDVQVDEPKAQSCMSERGWQSGSR
jgi:hypothetical protein